MIFDSIGNLKNYISLFPQLQNILNDPQLLVFEEGKLALSGSAKKIGMKYQTHSVSSSTVEFESHRKYCDLQIVLAGAEQVYISPTNELTVSQPFDTEQDFQLLSGEPLVTLLLKEGYFLILEPQDAHCTSASVNGQTSNIIKLVYKFEKE